MGLCRKKIAATSSLLLKVVLGVILSVAVVDAVALGNLEPWNLWSYGGRELKKRSTETEVEKEKTELEVRAAGRKIKRDKPLLSIKTQNGGMIYATKTRKIDISDAVALDVVCGRWEVCSLVKNKDSCVDIDSVCPCRKEATTSEPTPIHKVKLLKRRDCD